MPVPVVAADTDALNMLLYFCNNEMANILMLSDQLKVKKNY